MVTQLRGGDGKDTANLLRRSAAADLTRGSSASGGTGP